MTKHHLVKGKEGRTVKAPSSILFRSALIRVSDLVRVVLPVSFFYFLANVLFGIGCPFRFAFGISCAGCGMTRAWLSVLDGDLGLAFSYHPLFWVLPFAVAIWIFLDRIPKLLAKLLYAFGFSAFVLVYLVRMADPMDSVAVFNLEEGMVYHVLASMISSFPR